MVEVLVPPTTSGDTTSPVMVTLPISELEALSAFVSSVVKKPSFQRLFDAPTLREPEGSTSPVNDLSPPNVWEDVDTSPRAVAEASGKLNVSVWEDVVILGKRPEVPKRKVKTGPRT